MRLALKPFFAVIGLCSAANWNSPLNSVEKTAEPAGDTHELDDAREQKFELANGQFTIRVKWGRDQFGQREQLDARISFLPNRTRCPNCRKIGLIQVARVLDNHNKNVEWTGGESNRNILRTASGWFVDHRAASCVKGKAASPFYSKYWPNGARTGSNLPNRRPTPATIEDAPIGWDVMSAIYLETCAVDEDTGLVLGSIRWGGEWSILPNSQPTELKCEASDAPTPNFTQARARFAAFYARRMVALENLRNSTRRLALSFW